MMSRVHHSDGVAAAELAAFMGLILLPTLILVASLPTWWERASVSRLAAQQAARELALAHHWDAGAAAGRHAATQTAANHGLAPEEVAVAFDGALQRGGQVTATVTVQVPPTTVPLVATLAGFSYSSTHTEPVDAYRSFPR